MISYLRILLLTVFLVTNGFNTLGWAQTSSNSPTNATVNSLGSLGRIAIQEEGRIKPLDTYARTVLLQFSGKRTYEKKPAIDWLAKLLFRPWDTMSDKVFLINSPEIPMAINLTPVKNRLYSFLQLEPGINKLRELAISADAIEQKNRSLVEAEILRVYNNLSIYLKLRSALSFVMPHPDFEIRDSMLKTILDLPQADAMLSFIDIALKADILNSETKQLQTKKSDQWSAHEKEMMRLLQNLYQWSNNATGVGMNILPLDHSNSESWQSPWNMIKFHFSDPQVRSQLISIQKLALAYQKGSQLEFDFAAKEFNLSVTNNVPMIQKALYNKIPLEIFYNHSHMLFYAWLFYIFAFFTFLFSLIWDRPIFYRLGFGFLILGFIPHVTALLTRMTIMSRPPVTNLYETFIFVGVVCVLMSIITEKFNKQWLGILVGSISGFVFLAIADKFSAEGDTLKMLVAVLDSNFWLSTHVLTITIGYAGCSLAGIMGHIYILQLLFLRNKPELVKMTYRYTLGILGFGLTTAFLGTMLGGIWADQSWGRFWGWDPKENGALLIVLWSAILFHAKAGNLIKPLGFAVGSALGLIIVMWAWFGVNLLSIGLHSYGFTSGLAVNLAIYVVLEVLFLSVSVLILGRRGISI